ncbi:YcaO-like family protein [Bhargavaea ullalensis]|uniref:Ribosomal protein S12 methylthiotransferase accessory factor n=1 Tax=Bhargavaea ullalensis TaxID=1265685 RepID=A0ABV2G7D3_9BACL
MVTMSDVGGDARKLSDGELPVTVAHRFLFIGPLRNQNGFCPSCLKQRIEEVGLSDHYLGGDSPAEPDRAEQRLIVMYSERLRNSRDRHMLYALDRNTQEVTVLSTYKRSDCPACSSDPADAKTGEDAGGTGRPFNPADPRLRSWKEVTERIDRHSAMVRGSRLSIISRENRSGDSFGLPMVETEVRQNGVSLLSYGRTGTYGKSRYTSILESLERYATAFPYGRPDGVFREGEDPKIGLTLSQVMQAADMAPGDYSADKPIRYREAEELHSGERRLIPEQLIYFDSHHVSGEPRYLFESSNGSALGSTVGEASLFAMLELFERDAFLATWYGQIPPVRIAAGSIHSPVLKSYIVALQKKGIRVHLFDISMELRIPTIWVLLEKVGAGDEDMAFYTAAASSFELEDAIEKALIEATTAISVFQNVFSTAEFRERKKKLSRQPDAVSRLEDHLLLFSNPESGKYLEFALGTPHELSMDELDRTYERFGGSYEEVLGEFHRILKAGSDQVFRAVTPNPNMDEIGFVNVKYIVPGMLTMTFGHQNRRIIRRRVEQAIRFKGRGRLDENWLREVPHPFP